MFDVGFSELVVIALVALIVIGPERLPRVARTVGALLGRAQRYVNEVKADIQREVDLEELNNIRSTFEDAAKSVEQSVTKLGEELHATGESLNQSISGAAPAAAEAQAVEAHAAEAHVPGGAETAAEVAGDAHAQLDLGLEPEHAENAAAPPKA